MRHDCHYTPHGAKLLIWWLLFNLINLKSPIRAGHHFKLIKLKSILLPHIGGRHRLLCFITKWRKKTQQGNLLGSTQAVSLTAFSQLFFEPFPKLEISKFCKIRITLVCRKRDWRNCIVEVTFDCRAIIAPTRPWLALPQSRPRNSEEKSISKHDSRQFVADPSGNATADNLSH